MRDDYLAFHERAGSSQAVLRIIKTVAAELTAKGLTNFEDPAIKAKVDDLLENATVGRIVRRDGEAIASRNTLRNRFTYLRGMISHARARMGMLTDPLLGYEHPLLKLKDYVRQPEVYTIAEVRAVLALQRYDDPAWRAFALSVYAGAARRTARASTSRTSS